LGLDELLLTSLLLSGPDALPRLLRSGVKGRFKGENSPCLGAEGGNWWVEIGDGWGGCDGGAGSLVPSIEEIDMLGRGVGRLDGGGRSRPGPAPGPCANIE
jgi:hypothetical protein